MRYEARSAAPPGAVWDLLARPGALAPAPLGVAPQLTYGPVTALMARNLARVAADTVSKPPVTGYT